MKWTKAKAKKASNGNNSKAATFCYFVPLSKTEGVKFYPTRAMRNEAFKLQKKAFAVKLGPAVGAKCNMPPIYNNTPNAWYRKSPKRMWGYITQLVDVRDVDEIRYRRFEDLCRKHGISTNDMTTYHNCGALPDGTIVRYDFDPVYYNRHFLLG